MVEVPLLTICVPTYNRLGHIGKLIRLLDDLVNVGNAGEVEIVIVNNCSVDGTFEMLASEVPSYFRVVNRTLFLLTAEENMVRSLEYCGGRFVWFLGDDDVPVTHNFADYLAELRGDQADYFFFNPAFVDAAGSILTTQLIPMNVERFVGTTIDLIQLVGCTFAFAGISNHIVRRSLLSVDRGLHYLASSPIYSNVAWMVEAGAKARTVLVNSPLVYYRENDYDPEHWPHVARKLNVGDHFFWSLGLVDLFSTMIEAGVITYPKIGNIFEVGRDGSRRLLLNEIIFSTFRQIRLGLADPDPRQQLNAEQMRRLSRFCTRADGLTFDIMRSLERINHHALTVPDRRIDGPMVAADVSVFHRLFNSRVNAGHWIGRVTQHYMGFEILWTPMQYVGIFAGIPGLRDRVMRFIDPLPAPPLVFVAADRTALLALLRGYIAAHPEVIAENQALQSGPSETALVSRGTPVPRRGAAYFVSYPVALMRQAYRSGGISGIIARAGHGVRKHGLRGFAGLAFGGAVRPNQAAGMTISVDPAQSSQTDEAGTTR